MKILMSLTGAMLSIFTACDAYAAPCEPYNTQITQQFAAPAAAAEASGDTCRMTKVLIQELQATRKIVPKCFIGAEKKAALQSIDQQIATDKASFSSHCN